MTKTKAKRMTGKVISWHSGYGFIRADETGAEYFTHWSALNMEGYRQLEPGQIVEFELGPRPSNPDNSRIQANNVIILQDVEDNNGAA